jgi:gliding motility-associated lipoprotein GldB
MNISRAFKILFIAVLFCSCETDRLRVDVSGIEVEPVKIGRMEKDMFSMNPDSLTQESQKMMDRYGQFYVRFITSFINDGGLTDSTYGYNLRRFISDPDMRAVYNDCIKTYPDLSGLEEQLTDAFRHYKYHFPQKPLPAVVSMVSGFNYSVINTENTLGIGLEMYLGTDYKYYQMLFEPLPLYRRKNMTKDYILPDCLKGWMLTQNRFDMQKNDFLSTIVHQGKIYYMLDAMIPGTHDTLKIGYTAQQLEWCRQNEYQMWAYFMERQLLYTTDNAEIQKYIAEGPFTAAFNKESPAQVGVWIGWQIVREYMNRNPEITLEQLMEEKDAQRILTKARYKPERS